MSKDQGSASNCPKWAEEMLVKLRQMEVVLGNIPSAAKWKSEHLEQVQAKVFENHDREYSESDTELQFKRVVNGLVADGLNAAGIQALINEYVCYEGGPQYCTRGEVEEVIEA